MMTDTVTSRRTLLHLAGMMTTGATLTACGLPFTQTTKPKTSAAARRAEAESQKASAGTTTTAGSHAASTGTTTATSHSAGAGATTTADAHQTSATAKAGAEAGKPLTSDQALQKLIDGNKRYVAGSLTHPNQTPQRRAAVAAGQHPLAIIVGCSDSRATPEIVFDHGLGDLFVVRTAGNIVDPVALGSIEYAAEHLHAPLIVVMGHQKCGAVSAAVDALTKGGTAPGQIGMLIEATTPAVKQVQNHPGDLLDNAVKANVGLVVDRLKASKPILAELMHEGKLAIVGAYYHLEKGTVDLASLPKPAGH